MLAGQFSTIDLVDLAIVISVAEGLILILYFRFTGKGLAPADFALNLISGLFLMLALRHALVLSPWHWIALCLFCAGLAHWLDAWRRWQEKRQAP
jgi:hypothetical protein